MVRNLSRRKIVSLAIKLNDELRRMTNEIGNVGLHRHLPTEADAAQTLGLKMAPQKGLRASHGSAERFRSFKLTLADRRVRHLRPPPSLALPRKGGGNRDVDGVAPHATAIDIFTQLTAHALNPPAKVGKSSGRKP